MAIELSNETFTNQADIVPASGVEEIVNTGIANTLAGKDRITGTGETLQNILFYGLRTVGIYNKSNGTINTDNGDDEITGYGNIGIYNESNGTINTGNGRDKITGYASQTGSSSNNTIGVLNDGTINTDSGDDTISGYATGDFPGGVVNFGSINAGNGDDNIIGEGLSGGVNNLAGGTINTGNGDDSIIGTSSQDWGVYNGGYTDESGFATINTGNGDDSIIGTTTGSSAAGIAVVLKGVINTDNGNDSIIGTGPILGIRCGADGIIDTGDGNDILTGIGGIEIGSPPGSSSKGTIKTGNGNDIITSTRGIFNNTLGTIDTGAGNDSIISERIFTNTGQVFLGDGNDSIIANEGFESAPNSSGAWFLGEGEDYIKGFGSGDFYGGNGNDTLELTPGTYTVGIWGEGGESPIFTKGNQLMITSEFEKLLGG